MQFTIKQARKYAGFTQEKMAEGLGVHRNTYCKIEKDPSLATVGQIGKIAELTGVTVSDFILPFESTKVDFS